MGKRKYAVHKDAGKISREHDEQVVAAIREVLKQEANSATDNYSDADVAEMICNSGLLTHKGQVYELRLRNEIPNMRERKILNFAKRHKAKNRANGDR